MGCLTNTSDKRFSFGADLDLSLNSEFLNRNSISVGYGQLQVLCRISCLGRDLRSPLASSSF